MKRVFLGLSVLAAFAAVSSCKKEEKKTPVTSTFTLDGTAHTVVTATKNDSAYAFMDASLASVSFFFKTYPTASGTYRVNHDIDRDADEVDILIGTFSPLMVGGPTSAPATVNVTINDGKINIKCSGIAIDKEDGDDNSLGIGSLSADLTTDM